jgi:hypothetical protein
MAAMACAKAASAFCKALEEGEAVVPVARDDTEDIAYTRLLDDR